MGVRVYSCGYKVWCTHVGIRVYSCGCKGVVYAYLLA